ncbi:MAG: SUMF1/EgtB/PvdO family nonheme iron enzyme [Planctomycetes bacterium]|nr:SUMF1/EgtB/PvdO family nonheme iron enzyme [Planctomycetota bacterium]
MGAPNPASDPLVGKTLGSYRILQKIGEGGMGAVYHAVHTTLDREVAFKVVPDRLVKSRPEFAQRFLVEARAAAQVNHAYIVQVYDAGVVEGVHYIAMEFVRGATLKDILQKRNGPLPLRDALKIAQQAAKGLRAAARQKIIHRDIKPANIMLAHSGVVKVADFGLAKNLAVNQGITSDGQTIGTPAYMSPEQGDAENVDFRADIYALGCTLFEMATGRRPFEADSAVRYLMKHLQDPIPDPAAVNPAVDPGLKPVLDRMMAKKPADRYPSYDALIEDLNRLKSRLDGGSAEPAADDGDTTPLPAPAPGRPAGAPAPAALGTPTPSPTAVAPAPGRNRVALLAAGAAAVLLLLVAGIFALSSGSGRRDEPAPPPQASPPGAAPAPSAADRESEIRKILDRAGRLERELRYADALAVLGQVAAIDPDHRAAAEARARVQKALDASRGAAERESAYRSYWTAADSGKARAEISDEPADWEVVAETAQKAADQKPSEEAKALVRYARARGDLAEARRADREGDLSKAEALASRAASRGVRLEALEAFAAELRAKREKALGRAERKGKYDALAARALEAEGRGAEADLEAAAAAWREARGFADEAADRDLAERSEAKIVRDLAFRRGMARGEKAEAEGRWADALAAYEEALAAKAGDERAASEIGKVRSRIQETMAREREAREAGKRRLACEEFARQAEEAEKPRERGKAPDVDAALALWRKARECADDPELAKTCEARIDALLGPVVRKALNDARAAEARLDWVSADRACARALDAKPDDRAALAARARVAEKLKDALKLLGNSLRIPAADRDRFGNPVASRNGSWSDPESGLPFEVWLPEPRMEFVLAPPGRFKMGSPKGEPGHRAEENPQQNLHMAQAYYVGKYEVTRGDWKAVIGPPPGADRPDELPADGVSWHDARKFAGDLNRKIGASEDTPPYFALPSEAEWEFAARAGTATPFAAGATEKDLADAAWFSRNAEGVLRPVGKRAPNPWGVHDAHGNVWEWCQEYISDSLSRRFADAPEDARKAGRVLRGGAFDSPAADCRSARRHSLEPAESRPGVGFRLALKLHPPQAEAPPEKK